MFYMSYFPLIMFYMSYFPLIMFYMSYFPLIMFYRSYFPLIIWFYRSYFPLKQTKWSPFVQSSMTITYILFYNLFKILMQLQLVNFLFPIIYPQVFQKIQISTNCEKIIYTIVLHLYLVCNRCICWFHLLLLCHTYTF